MSAEFNSVVKITAVAMESSLFLVMVVSLNLQYGIAQGIPPPPSFTIMVVSPTSILISWQNVDTAISKHGVNGYKVSYERVTGAMQQGPCPFHGHNETLMFDGDMEFGVILTGLREFSTYDIHISARNEVGYSAPSTQNVTTMQAAPSSAPEWLNATATTSTTITIQWGAVPCMDQNSEITHYKVRYGPVGSSQRATDTVGGSASTGGVYTLTGLVPFTNYSIEVAAVNSNGDTGPYTHSILTATTNITISPEDIRVKAINSTAVLVSWSALELSGWNVSLYTIYYTIVAVPNCQAQPTSEHDVPGNTTSGTVVISDATPGLTHQFQVSGSLDIRRVVYEGPKSKERNITFNLNVTIHVTYNPPADLIQQTQNDYRAASGPVFANCSVQGARGTVSYQWSSTCRDCPFQSKNKPQSTRDFIRRGALHSGDTGTHTCTVNDGSGNAGTASIVMNIVGSGIHAFNPFWTGGTLTNNGLIVSGSISKFTPEYRIRFFCRSDSMMDNVGELIGLDGRTAVTSNNFFSINNPQPGELKVTNTIDLRSFPASKQGVYTCRIPLESGEQREINVGIYPIGFRTGPSINDCLVFTPGCPYSTLNCTSTGSPATTVTWMRDGQPLTIDGITYKLTQIVINRAKSTYENMLTINSQLNDTLSHTYRCTVSNVLGNASRELITSIPPVPQCSAEGLSPTSIKLSWSRAPECRVVSFRIVWNTALVQQKNCSVLAESGSVDVKSDVMEYILRGLETFHSYTINVTAANSIGSSTCSQNVTTLPAPPSGAPEWVNGTVIAFTTITIQWGAVPCMEQNSEITGYKVRYGPVGSSQRATDTVTGSASTGGVYTLSELVPFTNYSIEVAAVNSNGDTGPYTIPYFAATLISPPANVNIEAVNATAVKISWTKLQLPYWNLSHYTVYYTAAKQGRVIDQYHTIVKFPSEFTSPSVVVVLRNLMPDITHQFQVSCSLNTERGLVEGKRSTNRFTFDDELFQLQIGPVQHCITWQPSKAEKMDAIIHHQLTEAISCQCNCTFPYDFIRRGKFSCRNTTNKVSYRSTIVGTTAHSASQLVNFIQKWVSTGPILEMEWWLLDVYADCTVRISSLSDSECQGSNPVACNPDDQ